MFIEAGSVYRNTEMKNCVELILTATQIGVTAALGWYASKIARNQLWVNKNKLRLDFYDKRFALYTSFLEFIQKVVGNASLSISDLFGFHAQTKEAFFLMPETYPYMEEVFQKATRFRFLNERIKFLNSRHPNEPMAEDVGKRHAYIEEETEILGWFGDQLDVSKRTFSKYLSFPEASAEF